MTEHQRIDFRTLMMGLAAIHQRPLPREVLDSYFDAMRHLSLDAVKRAFKAATATATFFPKPVELIALAGTADAPVYREIDGEPVFACLECQDRGTVMHKPEGMGWCAYPCTCSRGEAVRMAWKKPDSIGRVVADQAKANARIIQRKGQEPL